MVPLPDDWPEVEPEVVDDPELVSAPPPRWSHQWFDCPEDVPAPDVVVDVPELPVELPEPVVGLPELVVVAGGSTTVMVCAALVIGVPVASCAVTVNVAVD